MQKRMRKNLFPVLLSSSIVCTVLSIYTAWIPLVTLCVILFSFGIFYLCDEVREKAQGGLAKMLAVIAVLSVFYLVFLNSNHVSVLGLLRSSQIEKPHFVVLALICSFAVSLAVYYFTCVYYRLYALLLLIFIPCMMYAVRRQFVPVIYIALNIILYFILLIDMRKPKDIKHGNYRSVIIGVSVFLAVMIGVMPKFAKTPYNYFAQNSKVSAEDSSVSLESQSGENDDRVVFQVEADTPLYLDSHSYTSFFRKEWTRIEDSFMGDFEVMDEETKSWSADLLLSLMKEAGELDTSFAREYGIEPSAIPETEAVKRTAVIEYDSFQSDNILHPALTDAVDGDFSDVYKNNYGEICLEEEERDKDLSYTISYIEPSEEATAWMREFFRDFTDDEYDDFLFDLNKVFDRHPLSEKYEKQNEQSWNIWEEFGYAERYNNLSMGGTLYPSIPELSASIVEGIEGDYEKAAAIAEYFHQGDFEYSLDYEGDEEHNGDIEYFLNESKTGRCSYFATAMTLLAREADLHVRYVEGFYSGDKKTDGAYQVSMKNYHAYPEVYLYGQGWTVFEPTVSYIGSSSSSFFRNLGNHDIMALVLISAAFLCLLAWLVYKYIVPAVKEIHFCKNVQEMDARYGILMLYERMKVYLEMKNRCSYQHFTPQMFYRYFRDYYYIDIGSFISSVTRVSYDNQDITEQEFSLALEQYKLVRKMIRQNRKNRGDVQEIIQEEGV